VGEVLNPADTGEDAGDRGRQRLLLAGGTVWSEDGSWPADVRVVGERITEVGALVPESGENVIDAAGLHVLPGMIDVHVHIDDRIGGVTLADTFLSASQAAVETGITTLAGFVTQSPDETLSAAVTRCVARASGHSYCDFFFHLTPTGWPWHWGEIERLIAQGWSTFKLYTTYRDAGLYTDYARLGEFMERLARLEARLLLHCEDETTLAGIDPALIDRTDPFSHTLLRPERAEVTAIERAVELCAATRCRLQVVHVSTAEGAAIIAQARARGPVSCETAPHYLLLDERALAGAEGYRFLCTPPLRSQPTRAEMEMLAVAGRFDLFATDHCAFSRADKDGHRGDASAVPKGIAGVGALMPLLFELLVKRHGRGLNELALRLAANPARLLGLYPKKGVVAPGSDADLVLVDPNGPPRPVRSTRADAYDPYADRSTTWSVRSVLRRGALVVRDNALVADSADGRCMAAL
jgi:dihydropyrimidinase